MEEREANKKRVGEIGCIARTSIQGSRIVLSQSLSCCVFSMATTASPRKGLCACRLANGRQQSASSLLLLDNYLPLGTKKAAKVYTIACHPLLMHVVAVGANAGESVQMLSHISFFSVAESVSRASLQDTCSCGGSCLMCVKKMQYTCSKETSYVCNCFPCSRSLHCSIIYMHLLKHSKCG